MPGTNAQETRRSSHQSHLAAGCAIAGAAAWAAVVHAKVPILPNDDAFIPFRYIENLWAGHGLVYNVGQHVCGASSPLFLVWLGLLKLILPGIPLPVSAVRLAFAPFLAAGLAAYFFVRRISGSVLVAGVAAVALLTNRQFLEISTGAMEPFLFLSLAMFALLAACANRPLAFGLLSGLAILARPEGVILLPVGMLPFLQRRQFRLRPLIRIAIGLVPPLLTWVIFAAIYYGSPIPESVVAKSKPLYPLPPHAAILRAISGVNSYFGLGHRYAAVAMLLAAAAACLMPRLRKGYGYLPAAWLLGILFLYWRGNPLILGWYWPLILLPAFLAVLLALAPAWFHIWEGASGRSPLAIGVSCFVAAVVLTWMIQGAAWSPSGPGPQTPWASARASAARLRVRAYQIAAEQINAQVKDAPSGVHAVAAPEIGALGYYLNGPILDACGLVSPEALPFLPVPADERTGPEVGAISTEFVKATDPEWVVSLPAFTVRSLAVSDWFHSRYALWGRVKLPIELWGATNIEVFRKRNQ